MRRFQQVDVFTDVALRGNPLAVVIDGDDIGEAEMQRFAEWTNLSETTFLLPPTTPEADYRVRIFTPSAELAFAGHPTLGSCHVWLASGGVAQGADRVVQECGVGLVEIRRDGDQLAFAAPPLLRSGPLDADLLDRVMTALNIGPDDVVDSAWVDNGPGWVGVELANADAVLAIEPGPLDGLDIGVVGPIVSPVVGGVGAVTDASDEPSFEVRAFFSVAGQTREDPVTGSLNASLAQWMIGAGKAVAPYSARQGTVLGRQGRISITQPVADGPIWVGGQVVTVVSGTVTL